MRRLDQALGVVDAAAEVEIDVAEGLDLAVAVVEAGAVEGDLMLAEEVAAGVVELAFCVGAAVVEDDIAASTGGGTAAVAAFAATGGGGFGNGHALVACGVVDDAVAVHGAFLTVKRRAFRAMSNFAKPVSLS